MANAYQRLEELNLTRDEVDKIGKAFKNEEFRRMFAEYVEEIQSPESKKIYEEEIVQLEKERGMDVQFLHPTPCYVIKTSVNGNQKAFINICVNELVQRPASTPAINAGGSRGLNWTLPHSLAPPHEDLDNKGVRCQVYDVMFHPDTMYLAEKNSQFRDMINKTALDAVEENFDVKLDKKNLKFPKLKYKGMARPCVIRKPSATPPEPKSPEEQAILDKIFAEARHYNLNTEKRKRKSKPKSDDTSKYTTPKYVIKHRSHVDMQEFRESKDAKMHAAIPKELILEVNLPLLKSSSDIVLDVTDKTVQLSSETPAKYKLHLTLPYPVFETNGNAKFDKDLKKLIVTLPVKRTALDMRDDSGVDSDHNSHSDHNSPGIIETTDDEESSDKSESSQQDTSASEFRTNFLDLNCHYSVPEFTCHLFENILAFTLNVKNVDESSVDKRIDSSSIHVKFSSISSSYFITNYAIYIQLPDNYKITDNTTVEIWDNNVILQLHLIGNTELKAYKFGVDPSNLEERILNEPAIINQALIEKEPESKSCETESKSCQNDNEKQALKKTEIKESRAIDICGTSYESSGDELSCSFSPSKSNGRGILKKMTKRYEMGRSISESSLDDFCSSFDGASLDPSIPEDGEMSTSLKKTVRFNDAVMKQLFRSNSSILGQKKKNQRKARNKKRANERRQWHSESETSEVEDKKERDSETKEVGGILKKKVSSPTEENKEFGNDSIFHLDMDH